MPLCFAYGSNMDREAMASRCPASRAVGPARLPRHRLVVMREGYLSVARDPRATVLGLLWDIALADIPALDRYEGVSSRLYVKRQIPVVTDAGPRRALVYLGTNAGPGLPRPGYLDGVVTAARAAGLPVGYVQALAMMGATREAPRAGRGTVRESVLPGTEHAAGTASSRVTPRAATPFDRPSGPDPRRRWEP